MDCNLKMLGHLVQAISIVVFYKISLKYLWFALALIIHLITNPRCERSILQIKKGDVFSPFNQILRFGQ